MKKILIATLAAIAGQTALAQAASGVTVYGLVDASMRRVNNATAARDSLNTMEDGVFTGTRLGIRGREDLGGGLAAVLTLESGFDLSNGQSLQGTPVGDYGQATAPTRFFGREAHVGLRGSWGGITAGRQYTVAHGIAARFQPLGNPNSLAHSLFSSHHIARQDNVVRFDAKAAGVDFNAAYTFGEQTSSSANSSWALGAGYAAAGLYLGGYVQEMKSLTGLETRTILGAGGNYKFGPALTLYGGVMRRTSEVSPQKNLAWTLGANIELAPQITLSLAHYDDQQSGGVALEGSRAVTWVTASYRFSRRTDVYGVVSNNHVEGGYAKPAFMGTKGSQTGVAFALRHRF